MDSALHPVHHQRRRIRYREPLGLLLALVLLPLGLALGLTAALPHLPRAAAATPWLRLLTLALYGATGFGLARGATSLHRPGYVELHDDAVLLPPSLLARHLLRVPYLSIQSLFTTGRAGSEVLVLRSGKGESRLLARAFPCRRDFDTVQTLIRRRIGGGIPPER